MVALASNQVQKRNEAKQKYENARDAGVTGKTLAELKAAYDAAQAEVESATNSSGGWGVVS